MLNSHKRDSFIIGIVIYIIAWIWFNDYWVCFFSAGVFLLGLYFLLKWRSVHYENDEDDDQYNQRNKEISIVYLVFCGVLSYKMAGWVIDMNQSKAKNVCGIVLTRHIIENHGRAYTPSTIRILSGQKEYVFEDSQYIIKDFNKNDNICVNYINKNDSIFLPKNYINQMTKQ